jgi:hypothetical protein
LSCCPWCAHRRFFQRCAVDTLQWCAVRGAWRRLDSSPPPPRHAAAARDAAVRAQAQRQCCAQKAAGGLWAACTRHGAYLTSLVTAMVQSTAQAARSPAPDRRRNVVPEERRMCCATSLLDWNSLAPRFAGNVAATRVAHQCLQVVAKCEPAKKKLKQAAPSKAAPQPRSLPMPKRPKRGSGAQLIALE